MDKYVCIPCLKCYKPEDTWTTLTGNLPVPKLIISVIGSAIDFHDYDGVKSYSFFKKALCHAVTSTGAWIITGKGNTKMVGEAVNEYIPPGKPNDQIVTLGIMTFETVFKKPFLEEGSRCSSATSDTEGAEVDHNDAEDAEVDHNDAEDSPLDHNHSHYLLLGTKTEDIYGGKIELRTKFENYISTKSEPVPIVTLVVEGGVNTMAAVRESVDKEIPVFVIEGTGGAADFISQGYKLTKPSENIPGKSDFPEGFDKTMKKYARSVHVLDKNSKQPTEEILEKCFNDLKETLQCTNLVTCFNLKTSHDSKDLFKTIVSAWIKAKNLDVKSQLKLAVEWNCYKHAKKQILNEKKRQNWKGKELYEPMMTALVENRVDFVELFIDSGVHLHKFMTTETLHSLYYKLFENKFEFFKLLIDDIRETRVGSFMDKSTDLLRNVDKLIEFLLMDQLLFYSDEKYILHDEDDVNLVENVYVNRKTTELADLEQHLFIWAVLSNRKEMAELFWKLGKDQLVAGLIASALLKSMSEEPKVKQELELHENLKEHATSFERCTIELLSKCYCINKNLTHQLLVQEVPSWGNLTLFRIADTYEMMDFMEHLSCQTKLDSIWKGQMLPYTSGLKRWTNSNKVENKSASDTSGSLKTQNTKYRVTLSGSDKTINILSAWMYFHTAPVTKFFFNVLSYIVFLAIFSYFVLVDLQPLGEPQSPSKCEIITWIWVFTMIAEEFRQILSRSECSFKYKVLNWSFNMWNRVDSFMYIMFILCFILRLSLTDSDIIWARKMYSVTLIVFYFRSLQFFLAAKNIGPKVIMILKMLIDLSNFIYIFLVFMVSFGVAYHVNMYPNSPLSWTILRDVLQLPYFQMYGKLFLDRIEGEETPGCTTNQSIWQEDPDLRCPEANWLSPVLLSIYLLMTNILLVNLLIAQFSSTFQTIQVKSRKVWSYYRLSLVTEYRDCPTLVPPFIILEHLFRIIRWMLYKKAKKTEDFSILPHFEREAAKKYLSYIIAEGQNLDKGVSKIEKCSVSVQTDNNLSKETDEKIDKIISMLTDTKQQAPTREQHQTTNDVTKKDEDA